VWRDVNVSKAQLPHYHGLPLARFYFPGPNGFVDVQWAILGFWIHLVDVPHVGQFWVDLSNLFDLKILVVEEVTGQLI
jgi:hypothetical protein